MTATPQIPRAQRLALQMQRLVLWVSKHWLLLFNGFFALYLGGAYLTPWLMQAGLETPARILYTLYGFTCHQLPQRSYFFGGEAGAFFASYDLPTLIAHGANPTNELTLRTFIGDPQLGYKAAIAHRLTGMYSGVLTAGLLYALVRHKHRLKPLPVWLLFFFLAPMAIDGTSHLINDLTGWGFRDTNAWAVRLTGGAFPPDFYVGSGVGTLNWLLRTVTGFLFGFGMIAFAYPLLEWGFEDMRREAETALARNLARLHAAAAPTQQEP